MVMMKLAVFSVATLMLSAVSVQLKQEASMHITSITRYEGHSAGNGIAALNMQHDHKKNVEGVPIVTFCNATSEAMTIDRYFDYLITYALHTI